MVPSPELYDQTSVCPSAALLAGGPHADQHLFFGHSDHLSARVLSYLRSLDRASTYRGGKRRDSQLSHFSDSPDPRSSKRNRRARAIAGCRTRYFYGAGGSILPAGGVVPLVLSLIRCTSMAAQAFSASANVLKGEPPTFMAHLL